MCFFLELFEVMKLNLQHHCCVILLLIWIILFKPNIDMGDIFIFPFMQIDTVLYIILAKLNK